MGESQCWHDYILGLVDVIGVGSIINESESSGSNLAIFIAGTIKIFMSYSLIW